VVLFSFVLPDIDYRDILQGVCGQVKSDDTNQNTIVVQRSRLLASSVAAIRKKCFLSSLKVAVEFSGEEAEDYGGPRREFFR
jgi:hypothetical protein